MIFRNVFLNFIVQKKETFGHHITHIVKLSRAEYKENELALTVLTLVFKHAHHTRTQTTNA